MKKKIFLAVIAVLVLCLTCGMLLVACNDDKPNPDDDTTPPVVPGGDDEEEESAVVDAVKDLVDDLDVVAQDANGEKEFNFGLEIVDKTKTENASVFAIATETFGGADYLYGAIGQTMIKFNGFDLGAVIEHVLGWLGDGSINVAGMNIGLNAKWWKTLGAGIVADAALTENVVVTENAYRFEIDLPGLAKLIGPMADNAIAENGLTDTIKTVIGAVSDVLGMNVNDPTVTGLLNAITAQYQVFVYFGFDGAAADEANTNPFDNMELGNRIVAARNANNGEAKNLLNFKGQIKIDAVDLTEVEDPATKEGKAPTYKEDVANSYVLDIVVDLNPFVLLQGGANDLGLLGYVVDNGKPIGGGFALGFDDFTVSDITKMLTEFGYMHISLDEVTTKATGTEGADDYVPAGSFVKNLFTLHYDSAENAAVAAAALVNKINGKDFAIGGVYNIDALGGLIDKLIKDAKPVEPAPDENASAETTTECVHEDKDNNCVCDKCGAALEHVDADNNGICDKQKCKKVIDFMALIGDVYKNLDSFYFINDTTKAITVNMTAIGEYLTDALLRNEDDAKIIMGLIPEVLGAGALRISVAEGAFGFANVKASDHIAMKDLVCNIRNDASFGENANVYMESITSISGTSLTAGSEVTVKGLAFDGKTEVTLKGVIMDVVTTGEGENATTTYYVGILTDLAVNEDVLEAIIDSIDPNIWTDDFEIPANWPFYGVLAYNKPAAA